MPRTKKTSNNAVKKIDKQLDKLLKDKKEMEDIPVINRAEIEKKLKEDEKKTTKKTTTKKSTTKTTTSKSTTKKTEKEKLKKNKEVNDEKLDKLSEELRKIYESDEVIEIEPDKKVRKKGPRKDKFIVIDEPLKDKTMPIEIVKPVGEEIETLGYKIIKVIAIILSVIFSLMLIALLVFIIYVCTY